MQSGNETVSHMSRNVWLKNLRREVRRAEGNTRGDQIVMPGAGVLVVRMWLKTWRQGSEMASVVSMASRVTSASAAMCRVREAGSRQVSAFASRSAFLRFACCGSVRDQAKKQFADE